MSLVAGIDFSSLAIDIVLLELDDLQPPQWHRYPLQGQDAFDRTRNVRSSMPPMSAWDDTLAIGIEHPAGKFGTGPMMRVQGAVLACLPSGVLVQPWPPSAWRRAVGLNGGASKGLVAAWAHAELNGRNLDAPWLPPAWLDAGAWPQDAYDAYCIALATRAALVPLAGDAA